MISGSGSNLQALIEAVQENVLDAQIVLVVSNRLAAYGLQRADQAGIDTLYFPLKPYRAAGQSREQYDADLAQKLQEYHPDLIVLAGWMHVLSPAFLNHFKRRVINLHPALPGQFDGVGAIRCAYEAYQAGEIEQTGVMVHYAVPGVDAGPVLVQETMPFLEGESLKDFEDRVHAAEHRLIVQAAQRTLDARNINSQVREEK